MEESLKFLDGLKVTGIYHILNMDNGHFYVGSSKDMRKRGASHLRDLRKGSHHNSHLQRAWNKYGEDRFVFIPIAECKQEKLIEEENRYIQICRGWNKCYNMSDANEIFNWTGRKHSKETLAKMSKSALKTRIRKLTEEQVLEIRELSKNKICYSAIAKRFSIATSTVYKIVHRKKWNHI